MKGSGCGLLDTSADNFLDEIQNTVISSQDRRVSNPPMRLSERVCLNLLEP